MKITCIANHCKTCSNCVNKRLEDPILLICQLYTE